jgi:small subunit ribosomal protein S7
MPRKREVPKRKVLPDPLYGEQILTKFVNAIMLGGKKSTAEQILYGALEIVKIRTHKDPILVFKKAMENVKPALEVKSRRVGGSNYQVPIEVRPERRTALAMRWLLQYSRSRSGHSMKEKLAGEIIDAFNLKGGAVKKREDTHKMAEANKAFAHYRW